MTDHPTVHASAVLVGRRGVLIRGPAGAGKSRLALSLIEAARTGIVRFSRLVADDRVSLEACHGRLLARAPDALAGLIEVRGLGIRKLPYEPVALIGALVELGVADAQRLPPPEQCQAAVAGLVLPRLAVAAGADPWPAVIAFLQGSPARAAVD